MSRLKDAALEKAVLLLVRPKLQRYGELRDFALDTATKCLSAELRLHGDPIPLVISEAQYRLEEQAGQTLLVLHGLKVSKTWVQNLLDDHFREIRLKVPDFVRPLLD